MDVKPELVKTINDLELYHTGPPLEEGPLPSLFYFALSGKETLSQDPYNQPIAYLTGKPIRCFAFSLPAHRSDINPRESIRSWKYSLLDGDNFFEPFIEKVIENIQNLINLNVVDENKIAVAGLSRGGLIALLLASREPKISTVVGYAPVTSFYFLSDAEMSIDPDIRKALTPDLKNLIHKNIRMYIGNRDIRVGTEDCFEFIHKLADEAYQAGIHSPKAELVVSPSIGYKGHGTPKEVFEAGAQFVFDTL